MLCHLRLTIAVTLLYCDCLLLLLSLFQIVSRWWLLNDELLGMFHDGVRLKVSKEMENNSSGRRVG